MLIDNVVTELANGRTKVETPTDPYAIGEKLTVEEADDHTYPPNEHRLVHIPGHPMLK